MVFFGLAKEDLLRQMDLFDMPKATSLKVKELFKAVDLLNRQYGRGKVFSAAEGMNKTWKMKRPFLPQIVGDGSVLRAQLADTARCAHGAELLAAHGTMIIIVLFVHE